MGRSVQLLTAVHAEPGITRAAAARALGLSSGLATDLGVRLTAQHLIEQQPAAPSGSRGRPTTVLRAHPEGPVVVCTSIEDARWQAAVIELGGGILEHRSGRHDQVAEEVVATLRAEVRAQRRRYGRRVRAVSVAVPGTVRGATILQAPGLGWRSVSLDALALSGLPLLSGNDATFGAVAEARRGAAAGSASSLHLYLDVGAGGALIEHGRVVPGATGQSGEFGHLPMGEPGRRCSCGAVGCWNTALDGLALARRLGRGRPRDQARFIRQVISRAGSDAASRVALEATGTALGRGVAGLVNALDPALVTVGGVGPALLEVAGDAVGLAYRGGLMDFRRDDPPPIVAAHLGAEAPLVGGAEAAFDRILTDDGLAAWNAR